MDPTPVLVILDTLEMELCSVVKNAQHHVMQCLCLDTMDPTPVLVILDTQEMVQCAQIYECSTSSPCHASATCIDTDGSYTCTCNSGYTGNGTMCTNIMNALPVAHVMQVLH
eukprot:gene6577-7321_t